MTSEDIAASDRISDRLAPIWHAEDIASGRVKASKARRTPQPNRDFTDKGPDSRHNE